ncbi:Asp23/Gls24 family envelope stress response protein [Streptomyces sp. NBC_00080]|uniref:Asp23/Gls24 family envelope stress response protein n=1 Tax=Streptomyces TaxID=1883 RepID=UPI00114E7395|nr:MULTISPECIES: Asp23/Gls24 family envelope stress response protein [Streptomyces]TQJ54643.1 putative alkaline shock family protein YloU [Streptomyces sp. SLBN-115]
MTENTGVKVGGAPGSRGRTTVADVVVEKIAGMAARDVLGVYALGGGLARSMGAMRERVPGAGSGKSATRGVSVEVGELQAAIDLELVVDYGVSITDVAAEVRENVISAVERMAGREVVEVNITVSDVKLPADEEDEGEERQRIQ